MPSTEAVRSSEMADTNATLTEAADAASVASGCVSCDLLPWVQTFLVPAVILVTAYLAWRVQRDVLARRAAFDYIANHELDQDWIDLTTLARQRLRARPKKDNWATIATDWSQGELSDDDVEHTKPIFRWLNQREFVSIGLLNGSMHQPTYAEWIGIQFIRDWEHAEPFVNAFRSVDAGDDGFFRNFEDLATSQTFRNLVQWTPASSIKSTS